MNIYESIAKIMEEIPAIGKGKTNTTQGFKYRGIDDVMNALQPLLAKNKVFIVPQILEQTREERTSTKGGKLIYSICRIKYVFYAEDGTFVEAITIGEGMDSGDKSTNKAMAIAMKYALFQVFCIPTEEMAKVDPDGESFEVGDNKKSNNKNNEWQVDNTEESPKLTVEQMKILIQTQEKYRVSYERFMEILRKHGYNRLEDVLIADFAKIGNALGKEK